MTDPDAFAAIDLAVLDTIHGGAARVNAPTRDRDAQLVRMLRTINSSIRELVGRPKSDPTQLLGMMGGLGAPPIATPPATSSAIGTPTPAPAVRGR